MKSVQWIKTATALLALVISSQSHGDDLLQIFNLAANNDAQVREARERFEASHTLVDQGRSQLMPSVSLQGNSARNANAPADFYSYGAGFNSHGWRLNLSQNLLNMEAWYAFQSAKQSDMAGATNLAIAEQDLILRVATAYFDVLRSQDNLDAFRAEEEAAAQVLQQTEQRFEVGLNATITDVYESQTSYDLTRVSRLVEENNLAQRLEALEVLTGQSHSMLESLDEEFPISGAVPAVLESWESAASENNLSVKAAEYQFESSKEDAKSARARHLPTLSLGANYNYNAESANPFSFFPGQANESAQISLSVTIPLYQGGLTSSRKRQAYHNRNATEEVLLFTRRGAVQNIRNAYRSVQTDVFTIAARQQAITSATSALEAVEVGAEVGTRNTVDVVLAQRTLFQALRDYANARYNYVINTLNLKNAAGSLNPQDIGDLNQWLQ
jgi:outer membrane protein